MQRFFGVSQDTSGNAIPSVTVTVNVAGTATLATLYSDNSYTPQANPFTSNTDGTYLYYASDGRYDVVLTKTGFTFTNSETSDVLLEDSTSAISPAQITSNQNNYNPTNSANASIWRLNSDATRYITGIAAPTANAGQRMLTLVNTGSFNLNLVNASGSSSVGNKFACANGRDYALFPNGQVRITYDVTSGVWRVPWQDAMVIAKSTTSVTVVSTSTPTTIILYTIPGGLLGTNSRLRFKVFGTYTNNTGATRSATPALGYGAGTATAVFANSLPTGVTAAVMPVTTDLVATGATNTQRFLVHVDISQNAGGTIASVPQDFGSSIAVDSTVDQTFGMLIALSAASIDLSYTSLMSQVEWLP